MSLVRYCLHVFGNVWTNNILPENNRRYRAFTKLDNNRLQTLQNRVMRMKLNEPCNSNTSCKELVRRSGEMSIQQLTAYFTLLQIFKTTQTQKPEYLANKLTLNKPNEGRVFPYRQLNTITINRNLTISRSGFFFRGSTLWNLLPVDLRTMDNADKFKKGVKKWIKENIPVKPP